MTIDWTLNPTVHRTASSNMLTFFENGTFMYGTHANVTNRRARVLPVRLAWRRRCVSRCTPTPTPARCFRRVQWPAGGSRRAHQHLHAWPQRHARHGDHRHRRHRGQAQRHHVECDADAREAGPPVTRATMTGSFQRLDRLCHYRNRRPRRYSRRPRWTGCSPNRSRPRAR